MLSHEHAKKCSLLDSNLYYKSWISFFHNFNICSLLNLCKKLQIWFPAKYMPGKSSRNSQLIFFSFLGSAVAREINGKYTSRIFLTDINVYARVSNKESQKSN